MAANTTTGKVLWSFDVPESDPTQTGRTIWAKPLVWNDKALIVGDFGGRLFSLDTHTGQHLWSFQEEQDSTGLYANEIWSQVGVTPKSEIVFTSNLGFIRLFDPSTGTQLTYGKWPISPTRRANASASPVRSDPKIFQRAAGRRGRNDLRLERGLVCICIFVRRYDEMEELRLLLVGYGRDDAPT